MIETISCF